MIRQIFADSACIWVGVAIGVWIDARPWWCLGWAAFALLVVVGLDLRAAWKRGES